MIEKYFRPTCPRKSYLLYPSFWDPRKTKDCSTLSSIFIRIAVENSYLLLFCLWGTGAVQMFFKKKFLLLEANSIIRWHLGDLRHPEGSNTRDSFQGRSKALLLIIWTHYVLRQLCSGEWAHTCGLYSMHRVQRGRFRLSARKSRLEEHKLVTGWAYGWNSWWSWTLDMWRSRLGGNERGRHSRR